MQVKVTGINKIEHMVQWNGTELSPHTEEPDRDRLPGREERESMCEEKERRGWGGD